MEMNQVTVPCTDYEASVAFYIALGMTQIVAAPPRYARFETSKEGGTLSIHLGNFVPLTSHIVYFDHASANELDEHVKELQKAGMKVSDPVDEGWGWREARVLDPDGNNICLMFAGTNRHFPEWRMAT